MPAGLGRWQLPLPPASGLMLDTLLLPAENLLTSWPIRKWLPGILEEYMRGPMISWRMELRGDSFCQRYNDNPGRNLLHLCPAYQLYQNKTYGLLVDRFGLNTVYILSAGWGLVRADYLLPYYDITFSPSAEAYKRRRESN